MEHFLVKLVENPDMEDPAEEAPDIHTHFTRYSKGKFTGPVLKITTNSKRINLYGSFEYENALETIATHLLPEGDYKVTGKVVAGRDLNEEFREMDIPVSLKAPGKRVKTKNYKGPLPESMSRAQLLDLLGNFEEDAYVLVSLKTPASVGINITTKKNPPRPNPKNPDAADPNKLVQFCKVKIPNTPENMEFAIEVLLRDLKDDLPDTFKRLILTNVYMFDKLELPKKKMPSRLLRLKTIRTGKLIREIELDGEELEKQYSIRA